MSLFADITHAQVRRPENPHTSVRVANPSYDNWWRTAVFSSPNNWRTVARSVSMPTFFEETDKKPPKKLTQPPAYCTRSSQSSTGEADAEKLEETLDKLPLASTSTMYCSAPDPPASTATTTARNVPDIYAPQVFDGVHPDPETWLAHFKRYLTCRQFSEEDQLAFFPLFLKGAAIDWYDTQATARSEVLNGRAAD